MNQTCTAYPDDININKTRKWAVLLVNSAIVLVLIVVFMGGWTRINDAGLSCPDWPGCFGQLTVPNSNAELTTANALYPNVVVEQHKSWLEMTHRYLAGALGLLILALAVIAVSMRKQANYPHMLSFSLLLLVGLQAMLGMWTVTLKLLPIVVTAHLFGGLLTTVLLLLLRNKIVALNNTTVKWEVTNTLILFGLLLLFLQILIGGWTSSNYAGWGCSDWLGCNPALDIEYNFSNAFAVTLDTTYSHQGGQLPLSERGAIQITHRIAALVVLAYFVGLYLFIAKTQIKSGLAGILVCLTVLQIILGLMNIVFAIPTLLAMAHHFVAVTMLISTTVLLAESFQTLDKGVKNGEA